MEQLDLVCCPECPSKGAMLREALPSHNNFFHGDMEVYRCEFTRASFR